MAGKKKLTPEQEKEIKLLQANNEMYERTKEEAKLRGTKDSIRRIEIAQEEVQGKIKSILDGNIENLEISKEEEVQPIVIEHKPIIEEPVNNVNDSEAETIFSVLEKHKRKEKEKLENVNKETETHKEQENRIKYGEEIVNPSNTTFNNVDSTAQYDVISLPSNGECYKNKIGRVPVAYLTAYDENIITSPNLYRDGLVIDYLLKNKVVNKDIDVNNFVSGDVDAIMLFLRATSYGTEYPVVATDPETNEEVEGIVDLSKIKTKEFKLKGDENGHFSYTLPLCKAEVKFKYLTRKEENDLALLAKIESEGTLSTELNAISENLDTYLKNDNVLEPREKTAILDSIRRISDWSKRVSKENDNKFNKSVTNRMEMHITSINGNTDRGYIRNFIYSMSARDSLALRRYILDNEPGLNLEVEVQKDESAGGGSFKTFLQWNDTIFLNIAG